MEEANERIRKATAQGTTMLDLSNLGLETTPKIPDIIEILILSNNKLNNLPILPSKLTDLYVDNNKLTDIDMLPENLELLSCVHNFISGFTALPEKLKLLDCRYNNFKTEPDVPKGCKLFILPSNYYKDETNKNDTVTKPVLSKPTSGYPELEVPEGTENSITYNDVEDGSHLVNFEGESKHQRYYLKSTYNSLMKKDKLNPYTKNPIKNAKNYTAKIKKGGKRTSLKKRRTN